MKKLLALILSVLLLISPCSTFADSEYYKFAEITLSNTTFSKLKSALESATGVKYRIVGGQITTAVEPPFTFMSIPVYTVYASSDPLGASQISICFTPYEIDGYSDGSVKAFDNGLYNLIREKVCARFGSSSRCFVHFFNGSISDADVFDDAASYSFDEMELLYILDDSCSFMFRNAYDGAFVEIYRKNTKESYIVTNATDQTLYGNVYVSFIVPSFTYYSDDVESLVDEKAYLAFPLFPLYHGVMQYKKDF